MSDLNGTDDGTDRQQGGFSNVASTYVAGEDQSRLENAARYLGLNAARRRLRPVREAVGTILTDSTLESARMHSVGFLATDERVDGGGTIHLMTLTRRRHRREGEVGATGRPDYGHLMDLFHTEPLEFGEVEEEEGDYEVVDIVEGGSITAAVFGIIKGTVGPAILYLPRGFQLAGYAVAIPALILATASYLYSANRLLQCWKVEKEKLARLEEVRALLEDPTVKRSNKTAKQGSVTYGAMEVEGGKIKETTEPKTVVGTLLTYPELARRAFGKSSFFVVIGIALMQFGVCLTYLIFVPQNLYESTRALFGVEVPKLNFLLFMLAMEIPLVWIRDIRKLTPLNILATFLIAYGLASCLGIAIFNDDASNFSDLPTVNDTWYLFIGTSFFVFEGSITLIVPLQEAVYREVDKAKFPSVNQTVTSWLVVFYIFFAMTCWVSFGEDVKTALTASLPEGAVSTSVQFAYSIAVIFTFPLQAFPALEVTCHVREQDAGNPKAIFKRNVLASFIVCGLGIVAILAIDYLGNVVSLLGSLVGIPIALIYPNLMHNKLAKGSSSSVRIMNYCVAGIGLFATAAASFTTIVSWDKGAEG